MNGFLELYEAVWGRPVSPDWLSWRFEETPYVDDVHVIVADDGDRLVGMEPVMALPVRADGETVLAHQPADWMVHPDFRRQGIFSRMTEYLLEDPPWDPPRFYFNFPSDAILPGLRKFGWRVAGTVPSCYRIQRPTGCLSDGNGSSVARKHAKAALDRLSGVSVRAYHRFHDPPVPDVDVDVTRHETPPVEVLADLYRSAVPERLHVVRDERFYRWRLANPRWEPVVYVARRSGRPVAALVTRNEEVDGIRMKSLFDALPFDGGTDEREVRAALVHAAVSDGAEADLLRAYGSVVSTETLSTFGFWPSDSFPLSALTSQTTMVVRPGGPDADGPWTVGRRDLATIDDWRLTLGDMDYD